MSLAVIILLILFCALCALTSIAGIAAECIILAAEWKKKRTSGRAGICVKCGYDLRATPHRWPECGTRTKETPGTAESNGPRPDAASSGAIYERRPHTSSNSLAKRIRLIVTLLIFGHINANYVLMILALVGECTRFNRPLPHPYDPTVLMLTLPAPLMCIGYQFLADQTSRARAYGQRELLWAEIMWASLLCAVGLSWWWLIRRYRRRARQELIPAVISSNAKTIRQQMICRKKRCENS